MRRLVTFNIECWSMILSCINSTGDVKAHSRSIWSARSATVNNAFRGCEMAKANKIIITCAVTGSIHTPSMSPSLPVTAKEIAEAAVGAAQAGAAIVHLHARNPVDGRPDQSPEAFEPFLRVIKQSSNVVMNLTTGGSPYMQVTERVAPAAVWKPEVASLNMGSMNFG